MKNKKQLIILFAVTLILIFTTCSKDEDSTNSVQNILTKGSWSIEQFKFTISSFQGNYEFQLKACQVDDTTVFYNEGSLKQYPSEIKCAENDYKSLDGTWQIADQGKSLVIKYDDLTELPMNLKFSIQEITNGRVALNIDYTSQINESNYSIKGDIIFSKK